MIIIIIIMRVSDIVCIWYMNCIIIIDLNIIIIIMYIIIMYIMTYNI
jgi:hypothetical protein